MSKYQISKYQISEYQKGKLKRFCSLLFTVYCLLFTVPCPLFTVNAQSSPDMYEFSRPDLKWYSIATKHFTIHFHSDKKGNNNSRTAQVVARIAEEIYPPITALYQHEPDTKVDIVLKDYEDYSNGAAYFFDNKIDIWSPALDTPLRGDHAWLRNVISHEFTHIIQVQTTMKASRRMPIMYFQYFGYEDVRRPDVLYGFPNVIGSYPMPVLNNPAWFAEGTAQFQRSRLHYDDWDSHRDMLLRTQVLSGKYYSLAEMGSFQSKTSLGRESVYNHGFAFTRYLAQRFGETILRDISQSLSKWRNWNMERAITEATKIPASQVYAEWIEALRASYTQNTAAIRSHEIGGELIEKQGFGNYYPKFSPDGTKVAYLSNRGRDFGATSLYIQDLATKTAQVFPLKGAPIEHGGMTCSFGESIMAGVSGAFDWHPDGKHLVYAKIKDTDIGHLYSDLYVLDLQTKKEVRLTTNQRAAAPHYSPDGNSVVFIQQGDGSTNLMRLNIADKSIAPVTQYAGGIQTTDVQWAKDGYLYFGKSTNGNRDIFRIHPDGTGEQPILAMEDADERSPFVDDKGEWLYFSSDASGIFNIFRKSLKNNNQNYVAQTLTSVTGGAFMPNVHGDKLVFSRYEADGYKIALLDAAVLPNPDMYKKPDVLAKQQRQGNALESKNTDSTNWQALNQADDSDLKAIPTDALPTNKRKQVPLILAGVSSATRDTLSIEGYQPTYGKMAFLPVFRMDYYNRLNRTIADQLSTGENLMRGAKVGVFLTSREIMEGFNFFGGLTIAPFSTTASTFNDFLAPSRIRRLERDMQLTFDYTKGFSFIPKRWSPQLSLEVYNVQRIAEKGLTIEEFPCTSCYPTNTYADVTYTLWEASLLARAKVNKKLLLTLGYRISPYKVRTESFYSAEQKSTISPSTSEYYRGRGFSLQANYEQLLPTRHENMLPEGIRAQALLELLPSRLLDRFDIENGSLIPIYKSNNINRLSLDVRYGLKLGQIGTTPHGLALKLKTSAIFGKEVDSFYNDYIGGLIGARGYPFYAIGGNKAALLNVSYQFPIIQRFTRQIAWLTPDKLYGRVYADAATAWSGATSNAKVRKDMGAELRLSLGSFYIFPTAIFVSGTYGFDRFNETLKNRLTTADGKTFVTYGREVLWHFGLLFNFDL